MVIDIGTGDGRFVLARAGSAPTELVIGVDAAPAGMVEASRRTTRPVRKGGLPNAIFVAAAVEALPPELDGLASAVTIHFPWGSLLRGILRSDVEVLGGLARIARPGAEIRALVSLTDRDGLGQIDHRALRATGPTAAGLELCEVRPATPAEIAAAHSSWAKRLRAGTDRPVWLLRWERSG